MAVASPARLAILRGASGILPWSLYSDSPLSSPPQPRGSDGDVTPCKVTREDFGLFLTSFHHALLQGGFKQLVRYVPGKARAGAILCRGLRRFRGDFGGHRSKPRGWGNSAGELA